MIKRRLSMKTSLLYLVIHIWINDDRYFLWACSILEIYIVYISVGNIWLTCSYWTTLTCHQHWTMKFWGTRFQLLKLSSHSLGILNSLICFFIRNFFYSIVLVCSLICIQLILYKRSHIHKLKDVDFHSYYKIEIW